MADTAPPIDPRQLEAAFSLFNEASTQLAAAYQDLQGRVDRLAGELAVANGELKRQYLEKQALSERLELLLDALPGGVVVLDSGGRVAVANPAARAWLGAALVGREWSAVGPPRRGGDAGDGEWVVGAGEGERHLTVSESPLDAAGGRILLLNDVTESLRMRAQLEHHKRLSAMGEMAAALAHQLRTPLHTALLYAAHLARPELQDADRLRYSERVRERLHHLERMIQDMLSFVRGQPGADEVFDLDGLLRDAAQILEPQMTARELRFVLEAAGQPANLRGSRKSLNGVVVNLLENAMQATPAGGEVRLSAVLRESVAAIRVSDTGCGIDPALHQRLFEPFFTTRQEGTGLGLAIVRSVVEAHGGQVSVESRPGEGSTFTLTLPLTAEAVAA